MAKGMSAERAERLEGVNSLVGVIREIPEGEQRNDLIMNLIQVCKPIYNKFTYNTNRYAGSGFSYGDFYEAIVYCLEKWNSSKTKYFYSYLCRIVSMRVADRFRKRGRRFDQESISIEAFVHGFKGISVDFEDEKTEGGREVMVKTQCYSGDYADDGFEYAEDRVAFEQVIGKVGLSPLQLQALRVYLRTGSQVEAYKACGRTEGWVCNTVLRKVRNSPALRELVACFRA